MPTTPQRLAGQTGVTLTGARVLDDQWFKFQAGTRKDRLATGAHKVFFGLPEEPHYTAAEIRL